MTSKFRLSTIFHSKLPAWIFLLSLTQVSVTSIADDIDVFVQPNTMNLSGATGQMMFVLDTSSSMNGEEIRTLREVLDDFITTVTDIEVGIMRTTDDLGAVLYPVTRVDSQGTWNPSDYLFQTYATTNKSAIAYDASGTEYTASSIAQETKSNGTMALNPSTVTLSSGAEGDDGDTVAIKFDNVRIPRGADLSDVEITLFGAADVQTRSFSYTERDFAVVTVNDSDKTEMRILAEMPGNSGKVSDLISTPYDLSIRKVASEEEPWTSDLGLDSGGDPEDETISATDIRKAVQEVINHPNWCVGNDIVILIKPPVGDDPDMKENDLGVEIDVRDPPTLDRAILTIHANAADALKPKLVIDWDDSSSDIAELDDQCLDANPTITSSTYKYVASRVLNVEDDVAETSDAMLVEEDIELKADQTVALRFANTRINSTTTLEQAYVEFTASEDHSSTPTITISAECDVDPQRFIELSAGAPYNADIEFTGSGANYTSDHTHKVATRIRTTNTTQCDWDFTGKARSINWTPEAWEKNKIYRTPDIKTLLNAIIGHEDWDYSKDIVLFFDTTGGTREFAEFREYDRDEGTAIESAKLIVEVDGNEPAANLQGNARADMRDVISQMITGGVTPLQGAYWESMLYWTAGQVDGGINRNDRRKYRISHPASLEAGTFFHNLPGACSYENYNDRDCQSESLSGSPTYAPPTVADTGSSCSVGSRVVLFSDGQPNRHKRDAEIRALVAGTTGFLSGTDGECLENNGGHTCMHELAQYMYQELSIATDVIYVDNGGSANLEDVKDEYPGVAYYGGGHATAVQIDSSLKNAFFQSYSLAKNATPIIVPPPVTAEAYGSFADSDSLYYSLFEPDSNTRSWAGNLKKFKLDGVKIVGISDLNALDSDGTFSSATRDFWSNSGAEDYSEVQVGGAVDQTPDWDTRNVYIYNENGSATNSTVDLSQTVLSTNNTSKAQFGDSSMSNTEFSNLIDWVKGKDDEGNTRNVYGDILHSSAVVFPYGAGTDSDPSERVVYITTNAGYLHAIDEDTGAERWAFMPSSMFSNQPLIRENGSIDLGHIYGLDSKITSWLIDTNNNQAIDHADDKALLFFGMRRGGDNYYALDVSSHASLPSNDTPKLKWFLDGGTGTGALAEMGQTWAKPIRVKIKVAGTVYNALILSGGYDPSNDDASATRTTDTKGRAIYIVNALTGEMLWSGGYNASSVNNSFDKTFADMKYSIPASVKTIQVDSDGLVDQFYVGDMGGQLWRFDVDNNNNSATTLIDAGVIADFGSDADTANNRRFYNSPTVFTNFDDYGNRYLGIAIGSGYVANPLEDTTVDRFFMVKQADVFSKPNSYTKLTESSLFDATSTATPSDAVETAKLKNNGWLITFPDSEKVLSTPTAFGSLLFTTYEPPSDQVNQQSCEANTGINRLYQISISDGSATIDDDRYKLIDAFINEISIFNTGDEYVVLTGTHKDPDDETTVTDPDGGYTIQGPPLGLHKTYWQEQVK